MASRRPASSRRRSWSGSGIPARRARSRSRSFAAQISSVRARISRAAADIASERMVAGAMPTTPHDLFASAASLRASDMFAPFLEDEKVVPVYGGLCRRMPQEALDDVELEAAHARHVLRGVPGDPPADDVA